MWDSVANGIVACVDHDCIRFVGFLTRNLVVLLSQLLKVAIFCADLIKDAFVIVGFVLRDFLDFSRVFDESS